MRKHPFVTGQYYHIYNRGSDKRDIFLSKKDVNRFLTSVKLFNSSIPAQSLRKSLQRKRDTSQGYILKETEKTPLVSIVCFCLNPNHFHFILKQETDNGISEFMKRLSGGYTKYFNELNKRTGVLFQGKFKSHMITTDQYFLKIFPYVNVNYLIHDIPDEKKFLIRASYEEYENSKYNFVSKIEAENLLQFYGGLDNFKNECGRVVDFTREERGKNGIFIED